MKIFLTIGLGGLAVASVILLPTVWGMLMAMICIGGLYLLEVQRESVDQKKREQYETTHAALLEEQAKRKGRP